MKKTNNLSVIGIGRLGLCFSLTLEKSGFNVIGCDIRRDYVDAINNKTFSSYEPSVNEFLKESKNFLATTDLEKTIQHAEIIFVTVATFSEPDGRYDVSQVDSVVNQLQDLGYQSKKKHLVICSNVNPGYSDSIFEKLAKLNWNVSYNPETIAQGSIIMNQLKPDCVYIGSDSPQLAYQLKEVYARVCLSEPTYHEMNRISTELTKVSMNCFLTVKISFANMVGDLANKIGANPDKVLHAIGSDSRINNKFFKYGFGWGGPCFPRDTRAFIRLAKNSNRPSDLCEASIAINNKHLENQVNDFIKSGETEYFTDTVTYKRGTTILEESQQLKFASELAKKGVKVTIKEHPDVVAILKKEYGGLFNYE